MIKKLFIVLLCGLGSYSGLQAQQLYNTVLQKAEQVVNDPRSDEVSVKINHFKSTALRYTKKMAFEQHKSVTTQFLDLQAYYLSDFLGRFFKELSQLQDNDEKTRKNCIWEYVNITVSNPLFEHVDKNVSESFLEDKNNLTPFNLNTDWEKACQALDERQQADNHKK
ncbi:MAG: hypothetical protein NC388_03650 [Clostridium sp.]|nr:hypothetical protein [Clostridium sp.]